MYLSAKCGDFSYDALLLMVLRRGGGMRFAAGMNCVHDPSNTSQIRE